MIELYTNKGLPEHVARRVVELISKNKKGFVDIMMVEELGILPDAESEVPWKNGLANFVSFLIFGIIPIIPYVIYVPISIAKHGNVNVYVPFLLTVILCVITMFGMGVVKGKITGTNWVTSGITTLLFGALGALVSFGIGYALQLAFPDIHLSG